MVVASSLSFSDSNRIFSEDLEEYKGYKGLGFVDFQMVPHYNDDADDQVIELIANETGETAYAIDDNTAIKVIDGEVEVISEG